MPVQVAGRDPATEVELVEGVREADVGATDVPEVRGPAQQQEFARRPSAVPVVKLVNHGPDRAAREDLGAERRPCFAAAGEQVDGGLPFSGGGEELASATGLGSLTTTARWVSRGRDSLRTDVLFRKKPDS